MLIQGHGLLGEGAAYDEEGNRKRFAGIAGPGFAKCQCGEMSEFLRSGGQRQRWHRLHKEEVLAAIKAARSGQGD